MTVKNVLEKVYCPEKCTPVLVYNNVHKEHPNYLNEEVESWKQGSNHGVVSIILK